MPSFSPNQQAFIATYAKATGLNPGVVAAQVAAEEPVGASSGWHGTQNWLNIGITDSGPMGAGNAAWQNPVKAAQLSAQWVKGQTSIPELGLGVEWVPEPRLAVQHVPRNESRSASRRRTYGRARSRGRCAARPGHDVRPGGL